MLRRFDWYLSLTGEFRLDEIRTLLLGDVRDELGSDAAAAVAAWFDRYLGLREAIAGAALSSDPATRIGQLRRLQQQWFGAYADALFGAELAELERTLARRGILSNADLTEAERDARLALVDSEREPESRSAEQEASAALLLDEQTSQFDRLGLSETQRREERAALWGEEAADRLARLDRAQADWDARVGRYIEARDALQRRADLSDAGRARLLDDLRNDLFDTGERTRIEALEAIGQLRPRG